MHFAMRISALSLDAVQRRAIFKIEALLGAAVRAPAPRSGNAIGDVGIARTAPQRLAQVESLCRVETEKPCAVRRQPAAIARAAERRGGRRHDAERRPVGEPKPTGRRSASW